MFKIFGTIFFKNNSKIIFQSKKHNQIQNYLMIKSNK